MKKVFLHIGHNKTGSSYLQAALANSYELLASHGLYYPVVKQMKYAAKGYISSGNGELLFSRIQEHGFLKDNSLYSSEIIFRKIVEEVGFKERLLKYLRAQKVEKLNILLYIRNPISHACSSFQQRVKRGGETIGIEEFFGEHYRAPTQVREVLDFFEEIPFAEVLVKNYDYDRYRLVDTFESWLGVPNGTLILPIARVVNRSLTYAELELQRQINLFLGKRAGPLSDYFCNDLPHVVPDKLIPPIEVQEKLWKRFEGEIEWINARIPLESRYDKSRDIVEPVNSSKDFVFSSDQLEVVARYISKHVLLAESQKPACLEKKKGLMDRIFGRH